MLRNRKPCCRGFTLIEVLVVILIIGIVASLILVAINMAKRKALDAVCISNLKQVGIALFSYAADNRGYLPHTSRGTGVGKNSPKNFCWFDKIDDYWTDENLSKAKQCPLVPEIGTGSGTTKDIHSYKMNERICWDVTYDYYRNWLKIGRAYPRTGLTSSGYYFFPIGKCKKKRETILLFDGRIDITQVSTQTSGVHGSADAGRHEGKTMILYFDGHVEAYDAQNQVGIKPNGLGWDSLGDLIWNPLKGVSGQ